jgi:aquaporin Z
MRKYLTEFIGTFFLVLTIVLLGNPRIGLQNGAFGPLAIGSVLMVMVYMGGHVSGGHYNPAVSFAVLLRGNLSLVGFGLYVIAQVLGGLAACGVAVRAINQASSIGPAPHTELVIAVMVEAIFTFALALVVLNVATSKGTQGNSFYGIAIGFTIFVAATVGGPISGGAFNPAVGTALTVSGYAWGNGTLNELWIYWVGPMVGGLVAALVFLIQEKSN